MKFNHTSIKLFILVIYIYFSFQYELRTKKNYGLLEYNNDIENMFAKYKGSGNQTPISSGKIGSSIAPLTNISDWLHISDQAFQDTYNYPPVLLSDGTKISIDCDNMNYRLNPLYNRNNKDDNLPKKSRDFFFTIAPKFLTYSTQKKDNNVIGAIKYTEIKTIQAEVFNDPLEYCFKILQIDQKQENWMICADTEEVKYKFLCEIQRRAEFPVSSACNGTLTMSKINSSAIVLEQKVIQPIIVVPEPARKCNEKWNYENEGDDWECFCAEGKEQSPIDLPAKVDAILSPVVPFFKFEDIPARAPYTTFEGMVKKNHYNKLRFMDNSLRIMHPNFGYAVTLDGSRYQAQEIIIHAPAEHTIAGKKLDMEIQIYMYGETKGDIAKQVILSILFEQKTGVYNQFIDDLDYFSLPNEEYPEKEITNNLFIPKIFYSSGDENIPALEPFSFYTYQGSMTEPPCAERTIVYVTADPIPIASVPLQLIKEALAKSESFDKEGNKIPAKQRFNARKVQPLNNRKVYLFDKSHYCSESIKNTIIEPKGHYEKIPTTASQYFYVNGDEASTVTGAYLVGKDEAEGKINTK